MLTALKELQKAEKRLRDEKNRMQADLSIFKDQLAKRIETAEQINEREVGYYRLNLENEIMQDLKKNKERIDQKTEQFSLRLKELNQDSIEYLVNEIIKEVEDIYGGF